MVTPIRSLGKRSGVNWMRVNLQARLRECLCEQRLADAGDVVEQDVAIGQERDGGHPHDVRLAEEDAAHVRPK